MLGITANWLLKMYFTYKQMQRNPLKFE